MLERIGKVHRGLRSSRMIAASVCVLLCALLIGTACPVFAAEGYDQVASGSEKAAPVEVIKYGMTPIRGQDVNDGNYEIEVDSSSTFFRIEKAILHVKNGKMTADLTLSSVSYKYVFPGTAEDAATADLKDYIAPKEKDGYGTFRMDISGLNEEIACAAFSKRKKLWYDRMILLEAGSLPEGALKIDLPDYEKIEKAMDAYEKGEGANDTSEKSGPAGTAASDDSNGAVPAALTSYDPIPLEMEDGEYSIQVNMTGGSGRASVTSPTWLVVRDGKAWTRLLWSSTYYDYMVVGGKKYMNETTDGGNSSFTIPIAAMDEPMPVIADTTAMGDPVEIEYELTFYRDSIGSKSQIPQEAATNVLIVALIIIVLGGILNFVIKRRRKQ